MQSLSAPHLKKKFVHRLPAYQSVFELLVATAVNVRLALASGHGGSIGPCPLRAKSRLFVHDASRAAFDPKSVARPVEPVILEADVPCVHRWQNPYRAYVLR